MQHNNEQPDWAAYREQELAEVLPVLLQLGYEIEQKQPHLGGERYLMQAVTTEGGKKLILLGQQQKGHRRVIIKATRDAAGIQELEHERKCRQTLKQINFAYEAFSFPEELYFGKHGGFLFSIQAFIEQAVPFLERPLVEQFNWALRAFKAQESAHATTYRHIRLVDATFGSMDARGYNNAFEEFRKNILAEYTDGGRLSYLLGHAQTLLEENFETIEQYCGFLTHVDFVPHNFRIAGDTMYLLDHSSLRFGNKYEGWARFLNFMLLYNPELEQALVQYVRANRAPEESISLRMMRIYRLGEIVWYYTNTLEKSSGDLLLLNKLRVEFWSKVLEASLAQQLLSPHVLEEYKKKRDSLRSEEEKERQRGLH